MVQTTETSNKAVFLLIKKCDKLLQVLSEGLETTSDSLPTCFESKIENYLRAPSTSHRRG